MTITITATTDTVCMAAWGVPASAMLPDHGKFEPDGSGWFRYQGTPFPVRRMTGGELVRVQIVDGKATEIRGESWVEDRIGRPGWAAFSTRAQRALSRALTAQEPTRAQKHEPVPLCVDCVDCIPLGGLDFDWRPAESGEACGAADHEENAQ